MESLLNLMGISDDRTRMKYLRLVQKMDEVEREHLLKKSQGKNR